MGKQLCLLWGWGPEEVTKGRNKQNRDLGLCWSWSGFSIHVGQC